MTPIIIGDPACTLVQNCCCLGNTPMAPGCDDSTNFCVGNVDGNPSASPGPAVCVDKGAQNLCVRCGSLEEPACVGAHLLLPG